MCRWRHLCLGLVVALVATLAPTIAVSARSVVVVSVDDLALVPTAAAADAGAGVVSAGVDEPVEPFQAVAVSWVGPADAALPIRVRSDGVWSRWQETEPADDLPDPDEADRAAEGAGATRRHGSPVWADRADAVLVQVPEAVSDVRVAVVRESVQTVVGASATGDVAGAAPMEDGPAIRLRSAWGANPARKVSYAGAVTRAVVHHTATTTDYAADDVPRILRSIQAFHQRTRGWDDIGYNFVVDRFGRIWEGRQGGITRAVIGAHTQGFNTGSFGVSLLGDHDAVAPSSAAIRATGELIGWRLTIDGADPAGRTAARSYGNPRYPAGAVVDFPCVTGHRDNKSTSCPGALLYPKLPEIRRIAAEQFSHVFGELESLRRVPEGLLVTGWVVDRSTIDPTQVALSIDGGPAALHTAAVRRADVEADHPGAGTNRGFAVVLRTGPGTHRVCATGVDDDRISHTDLGCLEATVESSPVGALDEATVVTGTAHVRGWALDPDADDPVEVDVLADGVPVATVAATDARPDVGAAHPGYGDEHGYEAVVDVPLDVVELCVRARNVGPGADQTVGCRAVGLPTDRFLVSLDDSRDAAATVAALHRLPDVEVVRTVPGSAGTISVRAPQAAAAAIEARAGVRSVVDEPTYTTAARSSDPCVTGCGDHVQSHLDAIRAPGAWDVTTGRDTVTVAIIDSGVTPDGPDLAGRVLSTVDYTGSGDDGRDDDVSSGGHGTMVAGLAAGDGDNGVGGAGVAWNVRIRSYKVLDRNGVGFLSDIAQAIRDAADDGADIINLSIVGDHTQAMEAAIEHASALGVVIVAAAGNVNSSSTRNRFPAAYREVIGVGSVDDDGAKAAFSNHSTCISDDFVALGAPGVDVTALDRSGTARSIDGTSFSAPLVTGVAALLLSADPDLTPDQIRRVLTRTARRPAGYDPRLGAGMVSAAAALAHRDEPGTGLGGRLLAVERRSDSAQIEAFVADGDDGAPTCWRLYVDGDPVAFGIADTPARIGGVRGWRFAAGVAIAADRSSEICLEVVGELDSAQVDCRMTVGGTAPMGNFEGLQPSPGGAIVHAWAFDPEGPGPVEVAATIDGEPAAVWRADAARPDVARVYPGYGEAHGLRERLDIPGGRHEVCLAATGFGEGPATVPLGCRTVSLSSSTIGNLDDVVRTPGGVRLVGWALDLGAVEPADVFAITAADDGRIGLTFGTADVARPDVGVAYPDHGPEHGFVLDVPVDESHQRVCMYAVDRDTGVVSSLPCRPLELTSDPFGALDSFVRHDDGTASVHGWALDPDQVDSPMVHLYGDGRYLGAFATDEVRDDVLLAQPGHDPRSGFVHRGTVFSDVDVVCAYAINEGSGSTNSLLGCRRATT